MEGLSAISAPMQLTIPLSEMLRPILSNSGKIQVPISGYTPFTSFTYVQGVHAAGGEGFSFSKLQILDAIIGSLVNLRQHRALEGVPNDPAALNDSQIDAVIKDMAKKLQVASTIVAPGIPEPIGDSFGIAVSQTGSAFDLSA